MIGRFFSAALRQAPQEVEDFDQDVDAAKRETERIGFAPMRSLQPPPAQNDDPLQGFCHVVEEDLRLAGYLR